MKASDKALQSEAKKMLKSGISAPECHLSGFLSRINRGVCPWPGAKKVPPRRGT